MAITYVTNVLKTYPPAATGIVLTPNAASGVFSDWFEIHSDLPDDWHIVEIAFHTSWPNGSAERNHIRFQLGTGAPGSQASIGDLDGDWGSHQNCNEQVMRFRAPRTVAAGSRLWVRLAKAGTTTADCRVSIGYYEGALAGSATIPTLTAAPTRASASVVLPSAAWTFSAWSELIASTAAELHLAMVTIVTDWFQVTLDRRFEVEIGVGTAGNETAVATVRNSKESNDFSLAFIIGGLRVCPVYPLRTIPAGSRVSVRIRKTGAGTPTWTAIASLYSGTLGDLATTGQSLFAPESAAFLSLGGSQNWGATPWTEFIASTAAPIAIIGMFGGTSTAAGDSHDTEVDVGYGPDDSNITIVTRFRLYPVINSISGPVYFPTDLPVASPEIPAGSRVWVRARFGGSASINMVAALHYIQNPGFNNRGQEQKTLPAAAAAPPSVPQAGAWVNSPWTVLSASIPEDILVTGGTPWQPTGLDSEYEVGVGPPNEEVVVATFRCPRDAQAPRHSHWRPIGYPFKIDEGSRIVFRARSNTTSGIQYKLALTYVSFVVPPPAVTGPEIKRYFIRRFRRGPDIAEENRQIIHSRIELDMDVGLANANPPGDDPVIFLQWSDDRGKTWSEPIPASVGKRGEYGVTVEWTRLGASHIRRYQYYMSDPIPWFIHGAILDARRGRG